MHKVALLIFAFIYVSNFLKIPFSAYTEDGNELMFQVRNTLDKGLFTIGSRARYNTLRSECFNFSHDVSHSLHAF